MSDQVAIEVIETVVAVEVIEEAGIHVLELIHPGPQGPAGPIGPSGDAAGLPTGGDPGNILMKTTNANYASNWAATLDGGTFN